MSGAPSQDGADYLLNLFSNSEQAVPFYYIALVTGDQPGITGSGDELDEPPYEDYARAELENISGNWSVVDGLLTNMIEIAFPIPASDWGEIRYWAICDDYSAGRMLYSGRIDDPIDITVGDQPILPAGAVTIEIELPSWQEDE